ncbi:DUF2194 domain-containing protein [Paenibacillus silviterrae]|uniref:DUF2194 domain-containing protein n=1 Tax=Paenibacillus silviterrae TaxID=3242194 RepID=UPI002542E68E|nr:DUF2194 domain-containing protein [Paenibacillus chinjuensis]
MKSKVRLKRNVYFIVVGIILLAFAIQVTQSQFVLNFSKNKAIHDSVSAWKPVAADPLLLTPSGEPYCVAFASDNDFSSKVKNNVERVLRYMKKPVKLFDVSKAEFKPSGCSTVIVTMEELTQLGDIDAVAHYVESGGYVLLAVHPMPDDSFYRLYRKLGIVNTGDLETAKGIHLTSNVLLGEKDLLVDDPFITNTVITVELDEKSQVLAKTANGIPLLWKYPYKQGAFMVFNGTMLQEKLNRGLISGALSLLLPDFIYPIFNTKLMYIDDFPAPIRKGLDARLYKEYHRDIPTFFKDVWWPDMLKAAKLNNVKYTAVLVQSYNDRVNPPFAAPDDEDIGGLISYGREVIKSGGEIGLHGYNHQSLQTSNEVADEYGYNAWNNVSDMEDSIKESVRFVSQAFPNYTMMSYVPPSNVLSSEGREALKRGWPALAVISSLYGEDATQLSYVQEFEIASDGILEMPRITSGYFERPFDRWFEANAITTHGIFSHFIHPDDMFDMNRSSGLSWEKLYKRYVDMLDRLKTVHPWLRPMNSTEAAMDMEKVLNSKVQFIRNGNKLQGTIEPFADKQYFIFRTTKSIGILSGCEIQKIDTGAYLVTAHHADFTIELGD